MLATAPSLTQGGAEGPRVQGGAWVEAPRQKTPDQSRAVGVGGWRLRRRPPSSRPPAPGRLRPENRPSGSPSPVTASLPEPTHRLLLPCQLINRLSGQVRDIDHLIRTLSDQSLAHLMGLLPCTHPASLSRAGAGGLGRLRLLPSAPQNPEPSASSEKGRATLVLITSQPGPARSGAQGATSSFAPALLTLPAPQLCGDSSWSSV